MLPLAQRLPKLPFSFPRRNPGYTWTKFLDGQDELTPEEVKALAVVPGNTAKAHGRGFCTWLFFRFADGVSPADRRSGLVSFVKECRGRGWHTSLVEQLAQWRDYKDRATELQGLVPATDPTATRPFGTVLLTRDSFKILGDPDDFLAFDGPFRSGMPATRQDLFDRADATSTIEPGDPWFGYGFEREFDLALFLARNTRRGCEALVRAAQIAAARWNLECVHRENGFAWKPDGEGSGMREPFGFRDGLSNLLFLGSDVAKYQATNRAMGEPAWNPVCDWHNVLMLDGPESLHGGSFVVLRKLEQNVAGLRAWEAENSRSFEPCVDFSARFIGRLRDGCPVTGLPESGRLNDFDYSSDATGQRCPFHAHIRKGNPRGTSTDPQERSRLFVRRGTVYAPNDRLALSDRPSAGVGLLFTGYMGRIHRQFAHVQAGWLHRPTFPNPDRGGPDILSAQPWQPDTASSFVTPRGGGYFFAPPVSWVEALQP